MSEPIYQRRDAGGIGEDGIPVLERFVSGDDYGTTFIPAVTDFEKQISSARIVGKISELVNCEQGGAQH